MYRYNTEYLSKKDNQIFYLICHKYPNSCHIVNDKIQPKPIEDNVFREKIITYLSELSSKPEEGINDMYTNAKRQEEIEIRRQHEERERSKEANYFFNQSSSNATEDELEYWAKMPYWTLDEAVALAFGKSPEKISWDKIASYRDIASFPKKYMNTQKLTNRALLARELISEYDVSRDTYRIKPCDFVSWAERKGVQIPDGLKKRVLENGNKSINWQALYEEKCEEIEQLKKELENSQSQRKELTVKVRASTNSNRIPKMALAVIAKDKYKYGEDSGAIGIMLSYFTKHGLNMDDKTLRDHINEGLDLLKSKNLD